MQPAVRGEHELISHQHLFEPLLGVFTLSHPDAHTHKHFRSLVSCGSLKAAVKPRLLWTREH